VLLIIKLYSLQISVTGTSSYVNLSLLEIFLPYNGSMLNGFFHFHYVFTTALKLTGILKCFSCYTF
jgi:hypothetical protein